MKKMRFELLKCRYSFHNQPILRFKQPMDQQTNPTLSATDQRTNGWLHQTKRLKIKIKPTKQPMNQILGAANHEPTSQPSSQSINRQWWQYDNIAKGKRNIGHSRSICIHDEGRGSWKSPYFTIGKCFGYTFGIFGHQYNLCFYLF